jgi:integrase
VFQGLKEDTGRRIMARACRDGKISHFSPKNLPERWASIWHHGGLPAKLLAERLGHSKASMSLDVYSHTLDPGEVEAEELRIATLNRPYRARRRAPVWPRCGPEALS